MSGRNETIIKILQDKQDIYDALMRYARGVDRLDIELMASAYHPDALDDHGGMVGPVTTFLPWAVNAARHIYDSSMHIFCNVRYDLDGDTAHTESYYYVLSVTKGTGKREIRGCRYIDRWEKRNKRWGIVARVCVQDVDEPDLDERNAEVGVNTEVFTPMRRDRNDISYMRPLQVDPKRFRQLPPIGEEKTTAYKFQKREEEPMKDTDAIVQRLADRQEIYDRMMDYSRGTDRLDPELMAKPYHADAWDDHGGMVGPIEPFITWAQSVVRNLYGSSLHSLCNHYCELDGDTAHTETYFILINTIQDGERELRGGRYIDRWEKREGRWGIVERICVVDVDEPNLDPRSDDVGIDGEVYVKTARDKTDVSYMRPLKVDRNRYRQMPPMESTGESK